MILWVLAGSLLASCFAYPDAAIGSKGFQPITQPRGLPNGKVFPRETAPVGKIESSVEHEGAESSRSQTYGGGGQAGPIQTFYVNVPEEQYPAPEPIHAGPPRKHYRIVFIRSPSRPPPQPIIPPRIEQKTLIYVLHPRTDQPQQNVVQVPDVKHDPQVYFIQYEDEPPTAEDLQDLVKNTIDGHAAAGGSGIYGQQGAAPAPAPAAVYPPAQAPQGSFSDNIQSVNSLNQFQSKSSLSQSFPVRVGQNYQNNNQGAQVIQSRPAPRDSLQISQNYQQYRQQPQPKYVRTRSTSNESKNKKKRRTGSTRFAERKSQVRIPTKRFTRDPVEPSEDLKSAFGSNLSRQFRFGSRLKTKRSEEEKTVETR